MLHIHNILWNSLICVYANESALEQSYFNGKPNLLLCPLGYNTIMFSPTKMSKF